MTTLATAMILFILPARGPALRVEGSTIDVGLIRRAGHKTVARTRLRAMMGTAMIMGPKATAMDLTATPAAVMVRAATTLMVSRMAIMTTVTATMQAASMARTPAIAVAVGARVRTSK